jgi:hypothetical protein
MGSMTGSLWVSESQGQTWIRASRGFAAYLRRALGVQNAVVPSKI